MHTYEALTISREKGMLHRAVLIALVHTVRCHAQVKGLDDRNDRMRPPAQPDIFHKAGEPSTCDFH